MARFISAKLKAFEMPTTPDRADALLREETSFGVFDYSKYPESTSRVVFDEPFNFMAIQINKLCSDLNADKAPIRIDVRINADPSVNAIAIPRDDGSIISMNAGMCVRLRQLFCFVASDEDVFPAQADDRVIGEAEALKFGLDSSILLKNPNLQIRGSATTDDDYVDLYGPIPHTRSRFALATSLATAAIDFVAMHEFAHIARRHIGICSHLGRTCFREATTDVTKHPSNDLLGMLCEVDADLIGAEIALHKFTEQRTLPEAWRGWAKTPKDALRLWSIAVLMTLKLLDGWSHRMSNAVDHPHPAPRLHTMMTGLVERLPFPMDEEDVLNLVSNALQDSRMLWARMGLPLDRIRPFAEDMNAVTNASLQLIQEYNTNFLSRL